MIVAGVEKTYEDTDGQKLLTDQRCVTPLSRTIKLSP